MAKRGKPEIDIEGCKGCTLCIGVCPVNILKMSNDFNKRGVAYAECVDESKCIACGFCGQICPDMAIRVVEYV